MAMTTRALFETMFDGPVAALELPGRVGSGADPALQVVDGIHRGEDVIGRATSADSILGLKVAAAGPGVRSYRVTVTLAMDDASLKWWDDRVSADVEPRNAVGARLVQVSSQGRTRAFTLLKRRKSDSGGQTRAVVEFELDAAEIDPDGLLVVELRSPHEQLPPWGVTAMPPYGAVGVRVDAIEVVPLTSAAEPRTAHLAGGHLPRRRTGEVEIRSGFFVANPGTAVSQSWALRAVLKRPERRVRYRRRKLIGMRVRRKSKRLVKELLPAATWPAARRVLRGYRVVHRYLADRRGALVARILAVPARAARPMASVRRSAGAVGVSAARKSRLAALLAEAITAGTIRAEAFDVGTGTAVGVTVTHDGRGRFRIRPVGALLAPVVVGVWTDPGVLGLRGWLCRRWLAWRLSTAGQSDAGAQPSIAASVVLRPSVHRPALHGEDGVANRATLVALLESGRGGTIQLPAGRYPMAGGTGVGTGWTIAGATDLTDLVTTLVQPEPVAEPMFQVIGSHSALRSLRLELPAASPGPHDGAHWTAVTVGRYFYPGPASWVTDVELEDLVVVRSGRCPANTVTVIGAVRDVRVRGLDISGGGTGVMVHWGGVGNDVTDITGPSYHPNRLTIEGLTVRSAFEGFCLSAAHDVLVRDTRCTDVEIGFRLLAGDNTDRYHHRGPDSEINHRITVDGCAIGWCGDLYAIRIAGWGRSEVDGQVSRRTFSDLRVLDCRIQPLPVLGTARKVRAAGPQPLVLEDAGDIDTTGITVVPDQRSS
jgi:hypothetical protein